MLKKLSVAVFAMFTLFACGGKQTNSTAEDLGMNETNSQLTKSDVFLLVGTYTQGASKGVYVYRLDTITGASEYVSELEMENPSYLEVSRDGRFVYAVSENDDNTASVSALSFNKITGSLSLINSQLTGGASPCYVAVDDSAKRVVSANYTGGSLTIYTTNNDGSLNPARRVISFSGSGPDAKRQASPHAHCAIFSPDGKYLFATDLGVDKIRKFDVHPRSSTLLFSMGTPDSFNVPAGEGPRHLTFHPNGKYAYLITEIGGNVIAYSYTNGDLKQIQLIQADSLRAQGSADIHVSPDGRFLYASNRLQGDGLAIFSINPDTGMLTKVGYQATGKHPRNFAITGNGKFLLVANRDSNTIQVFLIDSKTGLLKDTNQDIALDMPVCLKFAPMS